MDTDDPFVPDEATNPYGVTVLAEPLGRGDYTPEQRADLARWVVAMRRAHAADTAQTRERLHDDDGYCCLGLWCEVAETRGLVKSRAMTTYTEWRSPDMFDESWQSGSLPYAAHLARLSDPGLFRYVSRDESDDEGRLHEGAKDFAITVTATDANDTNGDTFDRIADLAVWSYALTDAELAAAEREPWVPTIEGMPGPDWNTSGATP